jgi:hypothetical protein
MKYKIRKGYLVFEPGLDEPVHEPSEMQLYAWLRARGLSDSEAGELIKKVDAEGQSFIELPKTAK